MQNQYGEFTLCIFKKVHDATIPAQSINQINFIFKNKLIWGFFLSLSVSPVVTMRAGQKMGD